MKAEEFQALVKEADYVKFTFQSDLKKLLIRTVDLECTVIQTQIKNLVAKAAMTLALALGISHRDIPQHHAREIALFNFELQHEKLLIHTEFDPFKPQEFFDIMKTVTDDPNDRHIYAESIDWNIRTTHPVHDQYSFLMHNLFAKSWANYLAVIDDRQQQLELEEFISTLQVSRTTEDVAMAIEEITPDNASLQDTINEAVSKQTQNLQNQIRELRKQVKSQKNSTPGAPKPPPNQNSRPETKKNASTPSRQRRPSSGPKAADVANASSNEPKKSASNKPTSKRMNSRNNNRKSKQK